MNTMAYLQFFDGLVEKKQGNFSMEKVATEICQPDLSGRALSYQCRICWDHKEYQGDGASRKEALRALYRKLRKFKKKSM